MKFHPIYPLLLSVFLICGSIRAEETKEPTPDSRARAKTTPKPVPPGQTLLFHTDFDDGNIVAWQPTDPKAWSVIQDGDRKVYALTGKSDYKPEVKSPLSFSLIKGVDVSDFVFEAKMRSTKPDYNHRDMCVIFGYVDPSHFYYVHMALKADEHANSIFLVNGAPRVTIAKERTDGTVWGDGYHDVRVERTVATGEIKIYFDDMEKPIMTTVDKTFTHGLVGVGSFDDIGNVDDVKLWGTPAIEKKAP